MNNPEVSPSNRTRKPRLGVLAIMYGMGATSSQILHGASDTLTAQMLHDDVLANVSLTRAALGAGSFAVCAAYYRRHYWRPRPEQQTHELIESIPVDAVILEFQPRELQHSDGNLADQVSGDDKIPA